MTRISELLPLQHNRIMDFIERAGVDVNDWKNFRSGVNIKKAPTNPKYCYSWSFLESHKVVVLNLWHRDLKKRHGRIVQDLDLQEQAKEYSALGNATWKRRAIAMDQAIQSALREKLPIRVVVCEGKMRDIASEQKASQVQRRMLDDVVWGITYYDWQTGKCTVTRAASNSLMDPSAEPMALIPEEVW